MIKRKLSSEQRKTIMGDLMQRYPRGNNGKLRHYHYRTHENNSWGEGRRLDDPVLDVNNPKLPPQEDDTHLGWPTSDIWLLDSSNYNIRSDLRSLFPGLTSRQLTMRSRRLERRISAVNRSVRASGRPGMYSVSESYGSDYQTYVYARSLGEAEQLSDMFLKPAANDKTLRVVFKDYASPEDISAWHALGKENVSASIKDMESRMERIQKQIDSMNAFQRSAEMVSNNISAMAAEKSLRDMEV